MGFYSKAIGVSIIALSVGSAANAQPVPSSKSSNEGLEEIVVTAQRRSESAQNVPISVTAFSGEEAAKVGLASAADLPSLIPGLTIAPGAARTPIYLRGVGNPGYSTSPAVLTFIDGVYQPFNNSGADYSNIQSIELAKGPQGTLFGRNATGGVIQITTPNPFAWQGLDVQVGYANYDTLSSKVYGSTKLSDKAAVDIAGFYENQDEGWGTNIADGSDAYRAKRYGAKSKLVVDLDDSFRATLTGDYAYRRGQVGMAISAPILSDGNNFLFNPITGQKVHLGPYDINSELTPYAQSHEIGGALTLEKEIGNIKLMSISSYRRDIEYFDGDFDGTGFFIARAQRHDERQAYSQEVQASGSGKGFNWVAGLYYLNMSSAITGPTFTTPVIDLAISSKDRTDAYAGYAQGTVEILPDTNLTFGARYTVEHRQIRGRVNTTSIVPVPPLFLPPGFYPGTDGTETATFRKPNFRVALDHHFTPDVLGYFSWSRGFNAGFFNQTSQGGFTLDVNPVVQPEEIDAYEVGVKSDFLDGRLRVNIAGFLYDYTNLQQNVFGPLGISTINAAASQIKGVDLDITARPVRPLILSVSLNYLSTSYDSYPMAPAYIFQPNGDFVLEPAPRDAKGHNLINAPQFGVQAAATYTMDTTVGTFDSTFTLNYQSDQWSDPQNRYAVEGRTLIGLTEQWKSTDEKTTVTLWVKNLTDEKYDVFYNLLEHAGLDASPGAPRTYGIIVGHKF